MNPAYEELHTLLNLLDTIAETSEEVGDTDVREQMGDAIHKGSLDPEDDYELPSTFGMFTDAGDKSVRNAISVFLTSVKPKIGSRGLGSPGERLHAFQDDEIKSSKGMFYDDYFGWAESS